MDSAGNSQKPDKKKQGIVKRYGKDRRGVVAIEFTFLFIPFFVLVFAIIEGGIAFGAQQLVTHAVDKVSRQVRTGGIHPNDITESGIHNELCNQIRLMAGPGCPHLHFDLNTVASFGNVPTTIPITGNSAENRRLDTSGFTTCIGAKGQPSYLRAYYRWPVLFLINPYSNASGMFNQRYNWSDLADREKLLVAIAVWQNEPNQIATGRCADAGS